MKIDAEDFRRHYASLSDEALLAMETDDLVEVARQCYDEEVSKRGLDLASEDSEVGLFDDEDEDIERYATSDFDGGDKPGWLDHAECVCSFSNHPGEDAAPRVEELRNVLEAAGIPCYVAVPRDEKNDKPMSGYNLMVPSSLSLEAMSLLDKQVFNPELEGTWKTHFEMLTDEELRAVKPKNLVAGLLDRAERLTRAYSEEMTRRRLRRDAD